ncbi:MAG: hypothetical protein F6K63_17465 [Moorea sp. SIO1G6]|uniref:Uncharacterized protein n=1 Tax=Moorena producens (strain JHB) TaxID=1454205 RepID=A0A9Q9STQ6_MOOP1|nr:MULTISPECIES: hypothetical protein [Moorena]NET66077.1 hypothetical protein [Moorena sp. SIO1G6]WAN69463.1 hypothetical protein BJP36_35830 [Moorena producens JHB]
MPRRALGMVARSPQRDAPSEPLRERNSAIRAKPDPSRTLYRHIAIIVSLTLGYIANTIGQDIISNPFNCP